MRMPEPHKRESRSCRPRFFRSGDVAREVGRASQGTLRVRPPRRTKGSGEVIARVAEPSRNGPERRQRIYREIISSAERASPPEGCLPTAPRAPSPRGERSRPSAERSICSTASPSSTSSPPWRSARRTVGWIRGELAGGDGGSDDGSSRLRRAADSSSHKNLHTQ